MKSFLQFSEPDTVHVAHAPAVVIVATHLRSRVDFATVQDIARSTSLDSGTVKSSLMTLVQKGKVELLYPRQAGTRVYRQSYRWQR